MCYNFLVASTTELLLSRIWGIDSCIILTLYFVVWVFSRADGSMGVSVGMAVEIHMWVEQVDCGIVGPGCGEALALSLLVFHPKY